MNFYVKDAAVSPDQALAIFQKVAQTYDVSVEKVTKGITEESGNKYQNQLYSGVFSPDSYPVGQLQITKGDFPQTPDEFLATYTTGTPEQSGTLYDFAANDHIQVGSLQAYYQEKGLVDGNYRLVSTKPFNNVSAINDIASAFNQSSEALLHPTTLEATLANPYLPFVVGAGVLMLLVFALLMASIPILHMKVVGVQKLLGWSSRQIWAASLKVLPLVALLGAALTDVILLLLIKEYSASFLIDLVGVEIAVFVLLMALASISFLIIKGYKTDAILKQSVSSSAPRVPAFVLKAAFVVFLAFFAIFVGPTINQTLQAYYAQQQWAKYGSYEVLSTTQPTSDDIDSIAAGDNRMTDKFAALYSLFNDSFHGMYIASSDYPCMDPNSPPLPGSFQTMTVNPNYLKTFPLQDSAGQPISVDESQAKRVVLVPQSRASEAASIGKKVCDSLQSLNEGFLQHGGAEESMPTYQVETIIYKDTHPFFSFDDQVGKDTGYLLTSPVFSVITDANATPAEKSNLAKTGLNTPFKFNLDSAGLARLQKQIMQTPLAANQPKFDTLENLTAEQITNTQNSMNFFLLTYGIVFVVNLVANFFLFSVVVLAKRKLLYVEKLQGLSLLYRFKGVLLTYGILYVVGFAFVALYTFASFWSLMLFASIVVLDALISFLIMRYLETRNTTLQLKEG